MEIHDKMPEYSVDQAFVLLTKEISRLADELVSQRDGHLALVREVNQQNVTLTSLAERITAHNSLLEERKSSDQRRIGSIEARLDSLEREQELLKRLKWRVVGAIGMLMLLLSQADRLMAWIL